MGKRLLANSIGSGMSAMLAAKFLKEGFQTYIDYIQLYRYQPISIAEQYR